MIGTSHHNTIMTNDDHITFLSKTVMNETFASPPVCVWGSRTEITFLQQCSEVSFSAENEQKATFCKL